MATPKTYDPACYDLAECFVSYLPDLSPAERAKVSDRLAAHVQQQIEDWLEYEMRTCECCGGPRAKGSHDNCIFF